MHYVIPVTQKGRVCIQGVLSLTAADSSTGSLMVYPRSHHHHASLAPFAKNDKVRNNNTHTCTYARNTHAHMHMPQRTHILGYTACMMITATTLTYFHAHNGCSGCSCLFSCCCVMILF